MGKRGPEPGESAEPAVPGWTPEAGTRLDAAIQAVGGSTKAAKLVGLGSVEQLAKWRDGRVRPPLFAIATIAKAGGMSLDWIVWGESPQTQPSQLAEAGATFIDPHLYGVISGEVARVYKEMGMAASPHTVGEEAARIAAEIAASGVGGDEALPAVRVLVAQLRRRLTSEIADPATRKRQG